jgi:hypothetical protein
LNLLYHRADIYPCAKERDAFNASFFKKRKNDEMTGTVVGGLKENHTYAPFGGFSSTRGSQRDVVYLGG